MNRTQLFSENLPVEVRNMILSYNDLAEIRGESDFYGASRIIANQLGLKTTPKSFSSWSHGCNAGTTMYSEQIAWNKSWALHKLVRNEEVATFMTHQGFRKIEAVGMPIIYVDKLIHNRMRKSILFMPAHSLSYVKIKQDVESIIKIAKMHKSNGHYVCFCVHRDCVEHGDVISVIEDSGLDWFAGASANDINSLQRMRNIFDYFEYVGSNTMGSHFFYSQLCGAKFFFTEPYFEYKPNMFLNDPILGKNKQKRDKIINASSKKRVKEQYPSYFEGLENAKSDYELASYVCGVSSKRTSDELALLLGWGLKEQITSRAISFVDRAFRRIKKLNI